MNNYEDIITAIATPIGIGGLSVIRVSGKGSIEKVSTIFMGRKALSDAKAFTAHFGKLVGPDGIIVDEIIATIFREPHSYTTEDMVEVSCHGGFYNARKTLDTILSTGIRLAQPGEFTKRAFLNGRIDLAQAEAVADMIQANSELYHRSAIAQLEGQISNEIKTATDKLLNICSLLELELDFADEGLEFQNRGQIEYEIKTIYNTIDKLIESYRFGRVYREGVRVVIVGKPNVGKSSILNALLNENRVIVSNIPGTTRDFIEENLLIDGILFKISDTAGIRPSADPTESDGMARAHKQIELADVLLIVIDSTDGITEEDDSIIKFVFSSQKFDGIHKIFVINKIDLGKVATETLSVLNHYSNKIITISAKNAKNIDELKTKLFDITNQRMSEQKENSITIISERHKDGLTRANRNLKLALNGLTDNRSNEFLVVDIRNAMSCLGEITGSVRNEDIINNIFSKFCIGK